MAELHAEVFFFNREIPVVSTVAYSYFKFYLIRCRSCRRFGWWHRRSHDSGPSSSRWEDFLREKLLFNSCQNVTDVLESKKSMDLTYLSLVFLVFVSFFVLSTFSWRFPVLTVKKSRQSVFSLSLFPSVQMMDHGFIFWSVFFSQKVESLNWNIKRNNNIRIFCLGKNLHGKEEEEEAAKGAEAAREQNPSWHRS